MPHRDAFRTGHKPFGIGLKPLDPARWIEPEPALGDYLAEKDRLFAERFGAVWAAQEDTSGAQAECLEALTTHLLATQPDIYAHDGETITVMGQRMERSDQPPLLYASQLVADDLVLMRKSADGWRLVAASLCFPSSWRLAEKFDRPMAAIHEPVPDFAGRMATMVDRIFDNLQPDIPAYRFNWSVYDSPDLHRAEPHENRIFDFGATLDPDKVFIRTERQTLVKLPKSGDIVFGIKISTASHADLLERSTDWADAFNGLAEQIRAMTEPQLAYKSVAAHRDKILDLLTSDRVGI